MFYRIHCQNTRQQQPFVYVCTEKDKKSRNATTNLDGDIALGDLPHVEANCGDHVFAELARLKQTNRSGVMLFFLFLPNP